ncbi:hypothetical protein ACH9L7_13010 [Haloferax sp. S1W]
MAADSLGDEVDARAWFDSPAALTRLTSENERELVRQPLLD